MSAVFLWPFHWTLRDIDHDYGKLRALCGQLLLARHMQCVALDEQIFNPLHSAAHNRLRNTPREADMEVGAILTPVLERHQKLILDREP
jgi:hypothetical protein